MSGRLLLPAHSVTSDAIHCADWRVLLAALPAQSVDLCLTDTPYGTTACAWDTVIDLAYWWREMRRVMKPRGAVVMTASQPYTSALVMSNPAWFRYEWIWRKPQGTDFLNVKRKPLENHENVLVFYSALGIYNPQMRTGRPYQTGARKQVTDSIRDKGIYGSPINNSGERYPETVFEFGVQRSQHPTQKPVALFEYLIRTYTHEGARVLDPFVGSGTTAVAARNTKRRYVCGDVSAAYVAIARERVRVEPFAPIVADDDVSDLPLFASQEVA